MSPTVDTCSVWTILPRVSSWDWECISQPGKLRTKKWWLCSSAVWLLELNLMSWKVKWSTYIKKNCFEMVSKCPSLISLQGSAEITFSLFSNWHDLKLPLAGVSPFQWFLGYFGAFLCIWASCVQLSHDLHLQPPLLVTTPQPLLSIALMGSPFWCAQPPPFGEG